MASGSGWNLWVWLVGVVVRRYYIDFIILLIPTPLVSVLFCSSILFIFLFFVLLEEEERRIPNRDFLLRGEYVNCAIIAMLYTHSIGNQQ